MNELKKPEMTPLNAPERKRTYHYADGGKMEIFNVVALCVRPSGSHRLETKDGRKWIIAAGWMAIELDMDEWTL